MVSFLAFRLLRFFLGTLNRAEGMVRRRIDGIDFQGDISRIDEIVPCAGGNDHGVAGVNFPAAGHLIFARSHYRQTAAAFNPQELVGITVNLRADIAAYRNAHQRYL